MKRLWWIIGISALALSWLWWWGGRYVGGGTTRRRRPRWRRCRRPVRPTGFARATEPNAIEFPRDLGPHDDYQTEWWYYTGNLATRPTAGASASSSPSSAAP
jgi:hypothetical protein